jgi:hypothetical protein
MPLRNKPRKTPPKTIELWIAWVTLATKVVVFLGALVGLAAAIVGLVTLLVRFQVGGDRSRPGNGHAPLQKLEVVEVADQATDVLLAKVGRHLLPARYVCVVDDEAAAGRELPADSTDVALVSGDLFPVVEGEAVLVQGGGGRDLQHMAED